MTENLEPVGVGCGCRFDLHSGERMILFSKKNRNLSEKLEAECFDIKYVAYYMRDAALSYKKKWIF